MVDFDLILPDLLETGEFNWHRRLRVEYLQDGYGPTSIWNDFTEHRLLYVINEHVTYFSYHTSIDDTATVARLVTRVRALIELLDGVTPLSSQERGGRPLGSVRFSRPLTTLARSHAHDH